MASETQQIAVGLDLDLDLDPERQSTGDEILGQFAELRKSTDTSTSTNTNTNPSISSSTSTSRPANSNTGGASASTSASATHSASPKISIKKKIVKKQTDNGNENDDDDVNSKKAPKKHLPGQQQHHQQQQGLTNLSPTPTPFPLEEKTKAVPKKHPPFSSSTTATDSATATATVPSPKPKKHPPVSAAVPSPSPRMKKHPPLSVSPSPSTQPKRTIAHPSPKPKKHPPATTNNNNKQTAPIPQSPVAKKRPSSSSNIMQSPQKHPPLSTRPSSSSKLLSPSLKKNGRYSKQPPNQQQQTQQQQQIKSKVPVLKNPTPKLKKKDAPGFTSPRQAEKAQKLFKQQQEETNATDSHPNEAKPQTNQQHDDSKQQTNGIQGLLSPPFLSESMSPPTSPVQESSLSLDAETGITNELISSSSLPLKSQNENMVESSSQNNEDEHFHVHNDTNTTSRDDATDPAESNTMTKMPPKERRHSIQDSPIPADDALGSNPSQASKPPEEYKGKDDTLKEQPTGIPLHKKEQRIKNGPKLSYDPHDDETLKKRNVTSGAKNKAIPATSSGNDSGIVNSAGETRALHEENDGNLAEAEIQRNKNDTNSNSSSRHLNEEDLLAASSMHMKVTNKTKKRKKKKPDEKASARTEKKKTASSSRSIDDGDDSTGGTSAPSSPTKKPPSLRSKKDAASGGSSRSLTGDVDSVSNTSEPSTPTKKSSTLRPKKRLSTSKKSPSRSKQPHKGEGSKSTSAATTGLNDEGSIIESASAPSSPSKKSRSKKTSSRTTTKSQNKQEEVNSSGTADNTSISPKEKTPKRSKKKIPAKSKSTPSSSSSSKRTTRPSKSKSTKDKSSSSSKGKREDNNADKNSAATFTVDTSVKREENKPQHDDKKPDIPFFSKDKGMLQKSLSDPEPQGEAVSSTGMTDREREANNEGTPPAAIDKNEYEVISKEHENITDNSIRPSNNTSVVVVDDSSVLQVPVEASSAAHINPIAIQTSLETITNKDTDDENDMETTPQIIMNYTPVTGYDRVSVDPEGETSKEKAGTVQSPAASSDIHEVSDEARGIDKKVNGDSLENFNFVASSESSRHVDRKINLDNVHQSQHPIEQATEDVAMNYRSDPEGTISPHHTDIDNDNDAQHDMLHLAAGNSIEQQSSGDEPIMPQENVKIEPEQVTEQQAPADEPGVSQAIGTSQCDEVVPAIDSSPVRNQKCIDRETTTDAPSGRPRDPPEHCSSPNDMKSTTDREQHITDRRPSTHIKHEQGPDTEIPTESRIGGRPVDLSPMDSPEDRVATTADEGEKLTTRHTANFKSPKGESAQKERDAKSTTPESASRSQKKQKKSPGKRKSTKKQQTLPTNVPFSDDDESLDGKKDGDDASDGSCHNQAVAGREQVISPVSEPQQVIIHPKSVESKRRVFDRRSSLEISPSSAGSGQMATPTTAKKTSPKLSKTQADWLSKKQADYLTAIATPRRGKRPAVLETPRGTPRRTINALNIATPRSAKQRSQTPPPRRSRKVFMKQDESDILDGYIESAVALLKDDSKKKEVSNAIHTIHMAKGFPRSRRLSMRDNELICNLIRAIQNDPSVKAIEVDCDPVFGTVQTTLLFNFIDSLRLNLHLTTLQFRGVELGNDFLYGLASILESNFALKKIDLSANCFTSEGLAEFCKALGNLNDTCIEVDLTDQTTPISIASQDDVLDAFRQNRSLTSVKLDFQSEDGAALLEEIMVRNRQDKTEINLDDKVVEVFRDMADLARELDEQKKSEEVVLRVPDDDWDYLYDLAVLFDRHKLKKEIQVLSDELNSNQKTIKENENLTGKKKSNFLFGKFRDILEESVACFNSDGSFLTEEFIAKYLVEDKDTSAIVFDFHGQWKLFKRFPPQDPHRRLIVTMFVDAIVRHSRANEFTGISMANTGCGDDFLVTLSERLTDDDTLLPNLQMLNFETNYVNETGVVALSKLIAHPTAAKYLQVVRLENQKGLLKSKAEVALMKALCVNRSVVVLGLRLRNLLEKQQINKYLVRNIDFIRQARQRHAKVTGKHRKRNEVEQVFDRVADNDPAIAKVDMLDCKRFLTLTKEEKFKAAASLANNSFVKVVNFNSSGIDDEFAIELGKAIRTNNTIEKLFLENNAISGEGIKALFQGLGQNNSIDEVRLHHQSKMIVSADEDLLADVLEPNTTITKIGIDLRSKVAQIKLDRKLKYNRNNRLKRRASAKQEDFQANEGFTYLKF